MNNITGHFLAATGLSFALAMPLEAADGPPAMGGGMMGGDHAMMRQMMQGMMGGAVPPGIDPALLPEPQSRGAKALQRYCTQCHNLPGPGMHTAGEWPAVMDRMNGRMRMMNGMMQVQAPAPAELKALVEYLLKHGQTPLDPAAYPDLETPAGRTFRTTCSQGHALPEPGQHTAREWPAVVERMQKNMTAMGKTAPDRAEVDAIIGFLQHHAKAVTTH